MKKIYLLSLLLSLSFVISAQKTLKSRKLDGTNFRTESSAPQVGFCWADRNLGLGETGFTFAGIPNAVIAGFVETPQLTTPHILKSISMPWGGDTDTKGQILVLNSDTTVVYAQTVTLNKGWNTFNLDEQQTLKAGKYYIGVLGHTINNKEKAYVLPFDKLGGEIIIPMANWAFTKTTPKDPKFNPMKFPGFSKGQKVPKVENISSLGFGSLVISFDLEGPDTKNYAILTYITGTTTSKPNEHHIFHATIRNVGANAINSFKVEFDTKGAAKQEQNITNTIGIGETKTVDVNYNFPASGILQMTQAKLSTLNGKNNPLINYGNNRTIVFNVISENGAFKVKNVLFEEFTTEQCPNCPRAKPIIEKAIEDLTKAGYKVAVAAHHAGFYTDWLTLPQSEELVPYVYRGNEFAPAFMVNRIYTNLKIINGDYMACANAIGPGIMKIIPDLLNSSLQYGNISSLMFSENGVSVKGNVVNGVDKDKVFLHIYICENDIHSKKQAGASKAYKHEGVVRKFVYPLEGKKLTIGSDNTFSAKAPVTLSPSWKKNKIYAVAFITGPLGKQGTEYPYRVVYASNSADFNNNAAAVKDVAVEKPHVSVINKCVKVNGDYFNFTIYNMEGKLVANNGTTQLLPGIYLVRVKTANGTFVYKVSVQ